jgi:hypothetical protein
MSQACEGWQKNDISFNRRIRKIFGGTALDLDAELVLRPAEATGSTFTFGP